MHLGLKGVGMTTIGFDTMCLSMCGAAGSQGTENVMGVATVLDMRVQITMHRGWEPINMLPFSKKAVVASQELFISGRVFSR